MPRDREPRSNRRVNRAPVRRRNPQTERTARHWHTGPGPENRQPRSATAARRIRSPAARGTGSTRAARARAESHRVGRLLAVRTDSPPRSVPAHRAGTIAGGHNSLVMQKIRAAVVGVGYLGRFHAQKYAQIQGCELIGVVDSRPEARSALSTELNVP